MNSQQSTSLKKKLFQTIIIEDEPDAREVLRELIRRFCPHLEICGEADGVASGLELIQQQQPDLVFIDIDIKGGSGFDILDVYPKPGFKIVFVTAHDDFALKAFKYRALHYLLKPIDPADLIAVANELSRPETLRPDEAIVQPAVTENPVGRLPLPTVQGTALIQISEIEYVQADDKYVKLVLESGEKFLITHALKDLEALLPDAAFLRVHQSFIVNINAVRKIQKVQGGVTLLLKSKTAIPVSRRNKSAVLSRLGVDLLP